MEIILVSNPSAVTTGISSTPVPLVQLAVNYGMTSHFAGCKG